MIRLCSHYIFGNSKSLRSPRHIPYALLRHLSEIHSGIERLQVRRISIHHNLGWIWSLPHRFSFPSQSLVIRVYLQAFWGNGKRSLPIISAFHSGRLWRSLLHSRYSRLWRCSPSKHCRWNKTQWLHGLIWGILYLRWDNSKESQTPCWARCDQVAALDMRAAWGQFQGWSPRFQYRKCVCFIESAKASYSFFRVSVKDLANTNRMLWRAKVISRIMH